MSLFHKSEEQLARRAAADAEIKRLNALSPEVLAIDLLPALAPGGPLSKSSARVQQLCQYALRDVPGIKATKALDVMPQVNEALDVLHRAGLVKPVSIQRMPNWTISNLGKAAIAEGTVEQRIRPTA